MAMNNSVKPVVANRTPSMYSKNGLWTNIVRRVGGGFTDQNAIPGNSFSYK